MDKHSPQDFIDASSKTVKQRKSSGKKSKAAEELKSFSEIQIDWVSPAIDGGQFPVKTVAGEPIVVEADIFKDGKDVIKAAICYRLKGQNNWRRSPMRFLENDRWQGTFTADENARYEYTVEAWTDPLESWVNFVQKKCRAIPNVKSDVAEGVLFLDVISKKAAAHRERAARLAKLLKLSDGASDEVLRITESEDFLKIVKENLIKEKVTQYDPVLELISDRKRAEFGAWYEMFPRSQGKKQGVSGTFRDCVKRLPDIKKMGFDVIYLPPIHPIGKTNRKGPNNSLKAVPDSPGSPWAIGAKEGGHKSIHPDLGTMKDFENFVAAANDFGIEIALDIAFQCSPDHPYVKEHPEWFYHLPDGTIRFAENPPKKYEDIYPINFGCENWTELWEELKSVVLFWVEHGVKIFRVDNPHTKPLVFWKWLIEEVQKDHPETIFLAEAFTRPKVMKYLAKAGFTQSYTYFTWRNYKWELQQYAEELTKSDMRHYFRGNFFANTPDILHEVLQKGGKPAFKMRLVLAATLSSVYGIYSGYEFCENQPLHEGSEEYLNSEKYEIKVRDWNQEGNIKDFIARINRIRSENPALQQYKNLQIFRSCNDSILCYGKKTPDNSNIIVVVVNLDPRHVQEDLVSLPIWEFGIEHWQTYQVKDLITGEKYYWKGESNYVRLDPWYEPAHIFRIKK